MADILPPAPVRPPPPRRRSSEEFRPKHAEKTRNQDMPHKPESIELAATSAHMATTLAERKDHGDRTDEILNDFADGKLDQDAALKDWKEKYRLRALNLQEDERYTSVRDSLIARWKESNPQPKGDNQLKEWEALYQRQLNEAQQAALRKFTRENFPDYKRYERYGLYVDGDGNISPTLDPAIQRVEHNIGEASYKEFPHHKATHLRRWRIVNAKVANRYWDSFAERFPEKAKLYAQKHHGISAALQRAKTK